MADTTKASVIAGMSFVGRSSGQVKLLSGFKKSHHSIPDAANAVTNAFLGKICASELGEEAEALFQSVRTGLAYKRKDIALSLSAPVATLQAKDFSVEIVYALEEADPSRYGITTTMRELHDLEVARGEAFNGIFAGKFTDLSFSLKKGARVEAVIDAIEALDGEGGLGVEYPSDCRNCTISVEGVDAVVRCTGGEIEMVFPRGGSPAELIEGFLAVQAAFRISKGLAGMIG